MQGLPYGNVTHLELSGYYFGCAVINASQTWCWGWGGWGSMGDGNTHSTTAPVMVKDLANNITDLTVGLGSGCVIEGTAADGSTGAVKCWGYNGNGELGDGTTALRSTPVDTGLRDAVMVSMSKAGSSHTTVLTSDGTLYAFGYNAYCQLGDGTKTTRYSPVEINLMSQYQVYHIAVGGHHTSVTTLDGAVMSWGYNAYGQVMVGAHSKNSAPRNPLSKPASQSLLTCHSPTLAGRRHQD